MEKKSETCKPCQGHPLRFHQILIFKAVSHIWQGLEKGGWGLEVAYQGINPLQVWMISNTSDLLLLCRAKLQPLEAQGSLDTSQTPPLNPNGQGRPSNIPNTKKHPIRSAHRLKTPVAWFISSIVFSSFQGPNNYKPMSEAPKNNRKTGMRPWNLQLTSTKSPKSSNPSTPLIHPKLARHSKSRIFGLHSWANISSSDLSLWLEKKKIYSRWLGEKKIWSSPFFFRPQSVKDGLASSVTRIGLKMAGSGNGQIKVYRSESRRNDLDIWLWETLGPQVPILGWFSSMLEGF